MTNIIREIAKDFYPFVEKERNPCNSACPYDTLFAYKIQVSFCHGFIESQENRKDMKISVLGYGTVGVGVCAMLEAAPGLELRYVLVRPGKADKPFKVTTIEEICADPETDAVAEVMGGVEPAFSYVSAALRAGKHVVTSNKALVAAHGPELAALAAEKGVGFLFSAACGGAVPFLHNLALAAESDRIVSIGGILNGTTNFMLDGMQRRGMEYAEALPDGGRLRA